MATDRNHTPGVLSFDRVTGDIFREAGNPGEPFSIVATVNLNSNTADEFDQFGAMFAAAPTMLEALKSADFPGWPHNAAITSDIEALRRICLAYSVWWNTEALPAIAAATA